MPTQRKRKMRQAEAIRQALAELGLDASREDVKAWLEAKGVQLTASFASVVSQQRRLLKEQAEQPERPTRAAPYYPDPLPSPGTVDVSALLELRKLVGEDLPTFKVWANRVERAVQLTGGFDKLRMFLDLWK